MDSTWSVRISDEMKEKISAMLSESGLNAKDLLTQIIQGYELKMSKSMQPLMEPDITELTSLTGRINNIYINLCERISNHQKQKDDENNLKLSEKVDMLTIFNIRIKEQYEKLFQMDEEIKSLKKENLDIFNQCTQSNEISVANKALATEYKDKNNLISIQLAEYKEFKSIVDDIKNDLFIQKELRQTAELRLVETENKVTVLNNQLAEEDVKFKINLQKELDLYQIIKEKEILQIRIDYQEKLEISQETYSNKTRELLSVIEEMQKSSKKVSEKNNIVNKNQ